jgi:hypothetical protein
MMKTTHSVFVPVSPTNWYSGESGTTVGMGATLGAEVGGERMEEEVFLRTSSNWSTIIMAAVRLLLGIGSDDTSAEG